MSEEQSAAGNATPPSPRPGGGPATAPLPAAAGATMLAVLVFLAAHLALLDAAVETFWSGSPIRWWIAPAAVLFTVISVWLWRPGAALARRAGWGGAATWSVAGLALLCAASAWMHDGQSAGLQMFRLPTTSLLVGLVAIAVVLASLVLMRLPAMLPAGARLVVRLVVIAVATYALLSLGLAIAHRTALASALGGGAAWLRLPRWLQGAWLGGLVLLPVGTLAAAARLFGRRGALRWATGSAFAFILAGFAIALAATMIPPNGGTTSGGAGAAAGGLPDTLGLSLSDLSADEKQRAYDSEVADLRDRATRLQTHFDGFPRQLVEVDALARVVTTPQAAFEFVRDQIAFEPYPGILKGARGTLVTRGGNALDRALLLAAILERNGTTARIAHGRLAPDQAGNLLREAAASPGATERMLSTLEGARPAFSPTAHQQEIASAVKHGAGEIGRMLRDAVERESPVILAAAKKVGAGRADRANQRQAELVADHYWVQATIADRVVDLDPSLKGNGFDQKLTAASDVVEPSALSGDLYQRLRFRVVGDYIDAGHIRSTDVLSRDFKAVDLFGRNIRVAIGPLTPRTDEATFQALLAVGDDKTTGQEFRLSGEAAGSNASAQSGSPDLGADSAAGGLLGGMSGTESTARPSAKPQAPGSRAGPVLGRLYVEVTSSGPHLVDAHDERVVMDRLDGSGATPRLDAALAGDEVVRALLVQAWDGAISIGSNNAVFVLGTQMETLKAQESMEERVRARLYLGESFGVGDLPAPVLSANLINFFFCSDVVRLLLGKAHGGAATSYYERPRVAFLRHGFQVGDWGQPQGEHRFAEGIDLINAPFQFVGAGEDATRTAVESGVADTALEAFFVRGGAPFNTLPLAAAAVAQNVRMMTVAPGDRRALEGLAIPAAIRGVLEKELARGQALIVPAGLVRLNGVQTFGWWSIDPGTSLALGKMELGGAQGMVEVTKINERVEKWTEILTKFYGGLLKCYFKALGDNLGAMDTLKTFHVKHGAPGESPMPDTDALADCVIAQTCDTIAEILAEAAIAPAFAKEGEALVRPLQEIITEWIGEQAAKKAQGLVKDAAAKACEERMKR
jgi:hypothetical protein